MSLPGFMVLLPTAVALWGLFRLSFGGEARFLVVTLLGASVALFCYCLWAWLFRDGPEVAVNITHGAVAWGKVWRASRIPTIAWGVVVALSWAIYKARNEPAV